MTREEVIKFLEQYIDNDCHTDKCQEAHRMATTALRAPTRERVEKMRGEWERGEYVCGEHEWECSKCHETEWRSTCSRLKFCPFCGAPMTDEAVDMMLERWKEAVDGEAKTD